ncbi:MAG: T9SS type A sorting domain-containing protein [Saprospiraceae bacterium]
MMFTAYLKKLQLLRFTHLSLSIFLLFFLFQKVQAQPLVEWSEELGGSLNDLPEVVYVTSNGDFIIAGQSASSDGSIDNNKGGADLWVTKLDGNGNLIWEKNYGGSEDDFAMDLQPTTDGGFILTGGSASSDGDLTNNNGRIDIWILKINALGELQWSKKYGGSGVDIGASIQLISGGYILAGCTGSAGESGVSAGFGGNEFWVLQLDLNGDLVWERTYGGKRHDVAKTIVVNNNGDYLVAGNTWSNDGDVSNNHGHGDAWVIKINNVGTLLWEKTFGGETPDRLNSLAKTNDGNYIFAGVKSEMDLVSNGFFGRYDEQYWVLKFSESGQVIWEKTFGGNKYDEAFSVEPTTDGGYIIGGSVQSDLDDFSNNAGNLDAWIIKTDATGTEEWSGLYGGAGNENLKSIAETSDGGYVMITATNSFFIDTTFVNNGFFDWWIVKFGGNSINVNLGNDLTVCHDETFTLNANVAGCNCTYLWNDGSTDAIRNLSITSTTNYSVTVTNTDGLEGVDHISVFTSQPSVNISTVDIPCFGYQGGSITLTPNDSNYSYLWNTGSTNQEITNLNAGTYTYTVTDGNGCTIVDEAIISEPPAVTILENIIEVDCNGNSTGSIDLNVSGGAGSFQYAWQSGEITQDIYNLNAGGYTVTITDMNGCIKVQDWVINQPPTIDIGPNPIATSCFDSEDGGAQMSINGGVGNFSYSWSNGSVNQNLSGVGVGTYTLTVTDGNLCQKITTVQVTSPIEIVIEETVQNADCFGNNSGSITTQISGGVGSYDFNWSNGATTSNLSQLSSGTYTLTITDDNFCEKVKEIIVNQNTDINVFSQLVMPSCYDSSDGSIDLFPSGGSGNFTFLWNTGAETEDIDELGNGDYIITITDGNGCEEIQLFTIIAPDSISIMSTVLDITCFGGIDGMIQTEAFGGNAGYQYLWSNNENTSIIDDLPEGNYTLTVTDINGCTQTEMFNLSQPNQILITPIFTEVSCYGMSDGAIDLEITGGNGDYILDWSSGANSGLPSGDYTVTVTDMNNCEVIQDIFLPQPDSLIISIQALGPINGNDGNIIATPTGGTSPYEFNWNDGMWDEAEISNLPAGIYDLIVTDANGCVENVSVLLESTSVFEIENLQTFEIFPNPNDGAFFIKLAFTQVENFEVSIVNNLGQIIYEYNRTDDFILEENDLGQIASGLFFIRIKTENGVVVKRVVIQQ